MSADVPEFRKSKKYEHLHPGGNRQFDMLRARLMESESQTLRSQQNSESSSEAALRYCLDTTPLLKNDIDLVRRCTYETVASCLPCRQKLVCRACVRHCHQNHTIETNFMRWDPNRDRCGCALSGRCRAAWSKTRAVFDRLVDALAPANHRGAKSEEVLHMRHFRILLEILHPQGLSEDDVDSGEVALHSLQGTISWIAFQRWHEPYFEEKRREVEAETNS